MLTLFIIEVVFDNPLGKRRKRQELLTLPEVRKQLNATARGHHARGTNFGQQSRENTVIISSKSSAT
jgi:hypothetical protein